MQKQVFPFIKLILAFAILVTIGCNNDTPANPKTKTELLTQGTWKFDKAVAVGTGDITSQVPACLKDNEATFHTNMTLDATEGTTVCAPSYAGTYTWAFQSNETVLQLSAPLFPGGSPDFTIVSLTEVNLVVSQLMTIPPFPATTIEVTWKH